MRPGRMRKSSSPLMAAAPHIAQSRGNPCRNHERAGRADQAHLAPMRHKLLKTHDRRSEEHTSELQSLMRISYAVFCLKKKKTNQTKNNVIPNTKCNINNTNTC